MNAEIIAIGTELLGAHRIDTNSLYLTGQLERLGIKVTRKTVVGDDLEDLKTALGEALDHASLVIAMGGLGPTEDDRTRKAVSELLDRPLEPNAEIEAWLRERYGRLQRPMPPVNLKQALVPRGGDWLPNRHGTAPALWIEPVEGKILLLLPGPPRELEPMFDEQVLPRLRQKVPRRAFADKILKTAGLTESELDEIAAPIYRRYQNPRTTILATPGEVQIHLRAEADAGGKALRLADQLSAELEEALGKYVFSRGSETMEQVVGLLLVMRGATLAVAESCTGGLLGQRITSVAGSSKYFLGGVLSYSDDVKRKLLKVPASVLKSKGAVSAEAAVAMAQGVRRALGARIGVAITGIAGPSGGAPDKPVGTVFVSVVGIKGDTTRKFCFAGDRERIRWLATQTALDLLRRKLLR